MSRALELDLGRRVYVRLRSTDRLIEAEVIGRSRERTDLHLFGGIDGLRMAHFERGLDIELLDGGDRYAAEDVAVSRVDVQGALLVLGPLERLPLAARRANFRERVELPVVLSANAKRVRGSTHDIGGGGACVFSDAACGLNVGDRVRFVVEATDGPIEGRGRVAWIQVGGARTDAIGVAFEALDGRGYDDLYRLLFQLQARRRSATRSPG